MHLELVPSTLSMIVRRPRQYLQVNGPTVHIAAPMTLVTVMKICKARVPVNPVLQFESSVEGAAAKVMPLLRDVLAPIHTVARMHDLER